MSHCRAPAYNMC